MVSKEKELELLDAFTDKLNELKMKEDALKKTKKWAAAEKELLKAWHELIAINPAARYFDEEISQTLHPEYFYD